MHEIGMMCAGYTMPVAARLLVYQLNQRNTVVEFDFLCIIQHHLVHIVRGM